MKNSLLVTTAIVTMIIATLFYNFFDIPCVSYFQALKGTTLHAVFSFITEFGKAEYILVPAALLYLLYRKKSPSLALKGGFIFTSVAASGIIVDIIKALAGRFRPELYFKENLFGFDFLHIAHNMTSFPSGHSATALGAGVGLALLYPRFRMPFIMIALLIMSSRVVIVRHYPSDVLVGAFIGAITSLILYEKLFKEKIQDA